MRAWFWRYASFLALFFLGVICSPSQAASLYFQNTDGAWLNVSGNSRLAQTFSTGNSAMTLDSVAVWIRIANSSNSSSTTSSFSLNLFALDANFKPTGSSLLNIGSATWGPWGDGISTFSSLNYSLAANTQYAVVMSGTGTIGWKYPGSATPTSSISPTPTFRDWTSSDSGSTWSDAAPANGFNMQVNATAVPEPASASLVILGIAGAMVLKKKRWM